MLTHSAKALSPMTAGLGLRRVMLDSFAGQTDYPLDFLEVAPENWINIGGRLKKGFRSISEQYPIFLHGLSLNIGGMAELDVELLDAIKQFMSEHGCPIYSEHLTYCGDDGHLYDLMPIPFTEEAVNHVAERVQRVQDHLQQRIALENASYYCAPSQGMSESEFINAVISKADCDLLLDVNNIYVNSINHQYDPYTFLQSLPLDRARYIHVAGHYDEAEDLKVDTHGADVIDPVWALLRAAFQLCGPLPTLLERDFNIPVMESLLQEVATIRGFQVESTAQPLQSALP